MYRTVFSSNSFSSNSFSTANNVVGSGSLGVFTGITMILFGVLILIEPRLLAAMVACFFFFAGAFVLMVSLALRSQGRAVSRDIDGIVTR